MAVLSEKINKAKQRRAKFIADARAIRDKADSEKRTLDAAETEQVTKILGGKDKQGNSVRGEIAEVDDEILGLENELKQLERLTQLEGESRAHDPRRTDTTRGGDGNEPRDRAQPTEHRHRLRLSGTERVIPLAQDGTHTDEYRRAWGNYLANGDQSGLRRAEQRDLQADNNALGGFLVAPQQFSANLIQAVDDLVLIRQWATVTSVPAAASLGMPSLDNDPADADWTGEIGPSTADTTMSFGKRELRPYQVMKEIKVSQKLLRLASGAESLVIQRLGYKFGVTQEKAFMTGDGVNKPLGLFTASNDGIPTSRDVNTGANTTFTFDGVIKAKWAIKTQYWGRPGFRYLFHRDCMREIALLKNSEGNYLLRLNASQGNEYTIDGTRVEMSEFAPATFTQNLYAGLVGDFSYYHIADSMAFSIQRIVDSEAARRGRVHFIGSHDADGMPVLGEAFARLKFSA